jgi:lipid A oxidase
MALRELAVSAVLVAGLAATPAAAEWEIAGYGGYTLTHDSDIRYSLPAAGTLTFPGVGWSGKSFDAPQYYGARLTRWFSDTSAWGLQIDFNHIKTIAKLTGAMGVAFNHFEFSHGLNLATLNGVYRFQGNEVFTPYVGAGVGFDVPHVEIFSNTPGVPNTYRYQVAGPAADAFVGVKAKLAWGFGAFAEYKFSYARVDADLTGGGEVSTNLFNHHFNVGLTYSFDLF